MSTCDMPARDIAERQRRAERDACAGIVAAHDAGHVVARGIEARDRLAVAIERARVLVGLYSCVSAEIANHHLDGVERPVLDRRDAGIRPMQRVALVAVIGARSLAESGIPPAGGVLVEFFDRSLESPGVDPGIGRKLGQRFATL